MKVNSQDLGIAMARVGCNFKRLAELSGISRATLSYINCGKTCGPDIAGKLAAALGVDVTEILKKED